jgi:hypothetical protein
VPNGYCINSGIFGLPPGFDLQKYIVFFGDQWEHNVWHSSYTWDEQGLVAFALLDYPRCCIIPHSTITNCEVEFRPAAGMHFVGLNRRKRHLPYLQYKFRKQYL